MHGRGSKIGRAGAVIPCGFEGQSRLSECARCGVKNPHDQSNFRHNSLTVQVIFHRFVKALSNLNVHSIIGAIQKRYSFIAVSLHRSSRRGKGGKLVAMLTPEVKCGFCLWLFCSASSRGRNASPRLGDNLQPSSPENIQSYETGYSLMVSCNNPQQRAYCVGFIVGVVDTHNSLSGTRADKGLRLCLTNGLLKSQVAAAAVKYLGEHQELLLNSDAASAAFEALSKVFPCI
jgi:Rap1a immunity proteins